MEQRHGDHEPGAAERLSRHARDLERRVPQRGQGEADREHRLLPRHDGRSDRRAADRPGDAAAVARTGDGPAARPSASATTATPASIRTISRGRRRPRRCRPRRIRASSSSACSAKAAARPTAAPRCRRRASLLDWVTRRHRPPAEASSGPAIAPRSASISTPSAKWSAASRRPRPTTADTPLPDLDRPVGVPAAYADHARLMFDLQVLALQGDVTRVITFQLARETSNRTYPEIGVPDPHHPLTHHGNDPEKIAQDGEDQRVPRVAVRRVPREAEGHAGGRRLAARPLALPLRQRHGQPERARPREPADPRRRRRRGQDEGRPAHPVRRSRRRWPTCT